MAQNVLQVSVVWTIETDGNYTKLLQANIATVWLNPPNRAWVLQVSLAYVYRPQLALYAFAQVV